MPSDLASDLPLAMLTAAEMRAAEAVSMAAGTPGEVLLERTGPGNTGGYGFVVTGLIRRQPRRSIVPRPC